MKITVFSLSDGDVAATTLAISRSEYLDAVRLGEKRIGAVRVGRSWYYHADEAGKVFRLTSSEVASIGRDGANYSAWCNGVGSLIRRPSAAVRVALGL